ncbi:Nucleoside-diphosphate-sugar epimerase [Nonomuraea solani]|uniref:Nucleoside-diphosphate-sugar epimerase n=1 Tax=Nonomuraea solani TaxID=1144553 RepID=A0A1H6ERP7_9ACTN|nr:alpha/beta fold hydrolase [Nonomuraea solani]SEH00537.1 Nucleoside-diphosphate-sugar epimerase [Nonomuraea solani]
MDAIVFGGGGFIGRSLVAELLGRGQSVAAGVRGRPERLTTWLADQGVDTGRLTVVTADISQPLTGLPEARDVYNTAGNYAFGLDPAQARAANVAGPLHVVDWAATVPGLRRLIHIGGYRIAEGQGGKSGGGAYEASKKEGDKAVRARARELGVPLTMAHPSTVIGPGQYIGLASVVHDLWRGRLPAVPGSPEVFLPVVTVGYVARFLAELPASPPGQDHWLLDDDTPLLPDLLRLLAGHMGVAAPRRHVPIGLLERLPRALTGADPETLPFLSTDRYPTASAHALAAGAGLSMPPVREELRHWADHLVASRFGTTEPWPGTQGFQDIAGSRTWVIGDRTRPAHVLLPGLPMNADMWAPLASHLKGPILTADLPGLGRSAPGESLDRWLEELLAPAETRPVLVGHSLACGPALRFAARHPDRVAGLVLVAPAFLQPVGPAYLRSAPAAALLRRAPVAKLLGLPADDPAVTASLADLERPGVARRVVKALRTAAAPANRAELRHLLTTVTVPVTIIAGTADAPVETALATAQVTGAGHYPQLTHPDQVADLLGV